MNARRLSATAVLFVALSLSRTSSADEEETKPAPAPPPAKKQTRWYGWQTLAVDAVATTLMVATVAESREPLEGAVSLLWPTRLLNESPQTNAAITGSLALYTLGPAFVHALHDRGTQAALSPGIRLFAPTLGTFTGAVYGLGAALVVAALDDGGGLFGSNSAAGTTFVICVGSGYVLGFAAPMLIDAVMFAREPIEPPAEGEGGEGKKARAPSIIWRPSVAVTPNGGTLVVGGTF